MTDEAEVFRRYLLGELSALEQDALERKLMTNDETFRELLIAEDELVDDYGSGDLSENERHRFEIHFLVTDERRRQVRFASALRDYANARSAGPFGNSWPRLREMNLSVWRLSAAAAVVALAAFGLWTFVGVGTERLRGGAEESRVVSLFLTAELRASGEMTTVVLPRGTQAIELQLDFNTDNHESYAVAVQRPDGAEVFSQMGLSPRSIGGHRVLIAGVPASLLAPGEYRIVLRGSSGDRLENIIRYDIRVQNE